MTKQKADLLQGTLDMLILKAVSLGPLHGYGIIQRIHQMSGEMLEVEQGSLYPALYRIEQRGWACSVRGRKVGTISRLSPASLRKTAWSSTRASPPGFAAATASPPSCPSSSPGPTA